MATKIRLMRLGKMRWPHYRIVVADARTKRDGRIIETIGKYHPKADPSLIEVDPERASYWLSVGAQPTEAVAAILRVTGDWQRFKGEPAPEPMKTAASRPDRRAVFEAAAREAAGMEDKPATTPRGARKPRTRAGEAEGAAGKAGAEPEAPAGGAASEPEAPVTGATTPPAEAATPEGGAAEEPAPDSASPAEPADGDKPAEE